MAKVANVPIRCYIDKKNAMPSILGKEIVYG